MDEIIDVFYFVYLKVVCNKIMQMAKIITVLVFFLFTVKSWSQSQSWIDDLTSKTVVFGKDTILDFQEKPGFIVKKRVFNIIGTGVIFYIKYFEKKDTITVPCIVTAKHVFYNPMENYLPTELNIRFKWDEKKSLDTYFGVNCKLLTDTKQRYWIAHPDSTVDLACIPINGETQQNLGIRKLPVLPYSIIGNMENSYESQEIFALGFPAIGGIDYGTKPIIRKGIISWISPINPNNVPFLIDCNIFPGNSGGPIFVNNSGLGKFGDFTMGAGFQFLGIVSKYSTKLNPIFSRTNRFILDQQKDVIFSQESFSIGIIEPAARIRELLEFAQQTINR